MILLLDLAWGVNLAASPNLSPSTHVRQSGPFHARGAAFQLLAILRELDDESPGLATAAVMMLTSDDRGGDIARSRALGITGYLVKPIKRSELFNAIAIALGRAQAMADAVRPAARGDGAEDQRALRLLLVEDSVDNQ